MNEKEFQQNGFLKQRQKDTFIMRFRAIGGNFTAEQLAKASQLAQEYGKGYLHFTTRQGMEIPWIKVEDREGVLSEAKKVGLLPGADGPRVRTIVACPGQEVCRWGIMNSRHLAEELDKRFFNREVPKKTKFAVSSCPNSCSKPVENDIGFMGAAKPLLKTDHCTGCGLCSKVCNAQAITMIDKQPVINDNQCINCGKCMVTCRAEALVPEKQGYHIYLGGKIGRFPRLGTKVATFVGEDEIIAYTEAILVTYEELANKNERIADVLVRVGLDDFVDKLHKNYTI